MIEIGGALIAGIIIGYIIAQLEPKLLQPWHPSEDDLDSLHRFGVEWVRTGIVTDEMRAWLVEQQKVNK